MKLVIKTDIDQVLYNIFAAAASYLTRNVPNLPRTVRSSDFTHYSMALGLASDIRQPILDFLVPHLPEGMDREREASRELQRRFGNDAFDYLFHRHPYRGVKRTLKRLKYRYHLLGCTSRSDDHLPDKRMQFFDNARERTHAWRAKHELPLDNIIFSFTKAEKVLAYCKDEGKTLHAVVDDSPEIINNFYRATRNLDHKPFLFVRDQPYNQDKLLEHDGFRPRMEQHGRKSQDVWDEILADERTIRLPNFRAIAKYLL